MLTQYQLFNEAHRKIAALNEEMMFLFNHPTNPMTNKDLVALIEKRPNIYGRFSGFVGKLKD